jgi:hypothetical protein
MGRNGAQQCRHVTSTTPPSPSETRRGRSSVSQNAAGIGERHRMTERQNLQANLAWSAAAPGRVATAALWDWPCPEIWTPHSEFSLLNSPLPPSGKRSPQGDGTPRQQIAVPGHATRHAAEARRPSMASCRTGALGSRPGWGSRPAYVQGTWLPVTMWFSTETAWHSGARSSCPRSTSG